MYLTILRLIWPYLLRYMAGQTAGYLQKQRDRRLGVVDEQEARGDCPPCPPCPPTEAPTTTETDPATPVETSSSSPIWYSLAGVLLGCALSIILYVFLQDTKD